MGIDIMIQIINENIAKDEEGRVVTRNANILCVLRILEKYTDADHPLTQEQIAEKIAKVFKQNHYLSCGKHYPGGGESRFDTHMTEGACDYTKEELIEKNLKPYKYLLEYFLRSK